MLPELCAGAEGAGALDATCESGTCAERVTGCVFRDPSRVEARDEVVGAFAIAGSRLTGDAGTSGRAGFGTSGEITPSDSVTAGAAGAAGADGAVGAGPSCSDVIAAAAWFCRTARYDPPAAAVRHPTANPAKTSLLKSIAIELLPSP
jgi:hypothetical protein